MEGDDQREVVAFLSDPSAYGHPRASIERIDTHISVVWLVNDRAYKLKRAVKFDYVDFSTRGLRRRACEAELRLNRRTAPALYLGVRPVTREADGTLALSGSGEPLDWVVEMARFDQSTLFDRLAEREALDLGVMEPLADAIASLHAAAAVRDDQGGSAGMQWVVDGNASGFGEQGAAILDPAQCAALTDDARAVVDRHGERLDTRRRRGFVRECHGDLHLRNICLVDGMPTLFDAVEFNDRISCVDVLYDLAFLLMDLWRRGLHVHASLVFNQYLIRCDDVTGLVLLPLFLSCRAAVRAKTSASAARVQQEPRARGQLERAARDYLTLARELLTARQPALIAVGGLSGSGKSTLARALAPEIGPVPGAMVIRSDVIRKRLLGVPSTTRLGPDGYAADVTNRVYRALAERAEAALAAGHAVIVDAVHARPDERQGIEAVARRARVPFVGLWLDGLAEVFAGRLRVRKGDVSDATPEVLAKQAKAGAGRVGWAPLDGSVEPGQVADAARSIIRQSLPRQSLVP
jgi:uncharacterized protein